MFQVISNSWALLLGMLLLMIGNGLQGTLLGVRGQIEGFSAAEMSVVMSAYFLGFLGGSRLAPQMIRRVGHVRVFAALASLVSAILILYPVFTNPWVWAVGRVVIGFCFSGVYVTAESWLNNSATNETRGQTLSAYMVIQMLGIVVAQGVMLAADPAGFLLFIIPSVLVSISFAPILLSISPTPAFDSTKPMTLKELWGISPLGCVGMLLVGAAFAAQFGMAAVFGAEAGLTVLEISIFVAMFYVSATVLQYPLGWLSDRMDRRQLVFLLALIGGVGALIGFLLVGVYAALLVAAFVIGGVSSPLYTLLIAYTNDFLEPDDMAAASSGMVFIFGLGSISGPLVIGGLMGWIGPGGFFLVILASLGAMALYALYRMTQRPSVPVEDTSTYAPLMPSSSPVAVELAQEVAIGAIEDQAEGQAAQ